MSSKHLFFFNSASNTLFFFPPTATTEYSSCIWTEVLKWMSYIRQSKVDTSQSTEFGSCVFLTAGRNEYALCIMRIMYVEEGPVSFHSHNNKSLWFLFNKVLLFLDHSNSTVWFLYLVSHFLSSGVNGEAWRQWMFDQCFRPEAPSFPTANCLAWAVKHHLA